MSIAPGTRRGPYEILSPLGAGGMGEVYKARDTRLDRIVAIKFSKEAFSERFEREARAVATLNHPNICQLYDVGPDYLVMEFVEGTAIASVDSTRKLLDIAVQIADGLAAAHAAGIIHRDLKLDNILIARDGRVRILDFGLAKIVAPDNAEADATRALTRTETGVTLGTISYMSPEQARGSADLSAQSDQFSFGLILYELAAGRRPFARSSAPEIMTAIIREEADPLPPTIPAPLRWIVERLLAKDPADRYESTRDLYRELRQLRDRLSESSTVSGVQAASAVAIPSRQRSWPKAWMICAGLALGILCGGIGWMLHPASGVENLRFTPIEVSWENPSGGFWSPDGKAFAYSAGAAGGRRLFLRYLNSPTPVTLTRSAETWDPVGWSPDNKRVLVVGKNPPGADMPYTLFSVPVFGGEPDVAMPIDNRFILPGVRLSADGKALVALLIDENRKLELYTASPVGSALKRYTPAPFETDSWSNQPYAQFSPDLRSITLVVDAMGGRQVWKLPYPSGQGTPGRVFGSVPENAFGGWSPFRDGRSGLWSFGGHVWVADLRSGVRKAVTTGISSESQAQPALSPDGKHLLFTQSRRDYMIVSASLSDASVERVISSEVATGMPAWAQHRNAFVYASERSGSSAIWMRSEDGERPIVTDDAFPSGTRGMFIIPTLSPQADRVVYTRGTGGSNDQFNWISSLSGGPPVRLTNAKDVIERSGSWSPDGSRIVYWQFRNGSVSIMVVRTTGEATPVTLCEKAGLALPGWSPDGQWIKFVDARTPGAGWTLSSPDGKTLRSYGEPNTIDMTFSADSKRLFGIRVEPDRRTLFSLDIASKEVKTIGEIPRDFTPASYNNPGVRLSLSPDGKSILYPATRRTSGLWMMDGFDQPGWLDRLRETMPW